MELKKRIPADGFAGLVSTGSEAGEALDSTISTMLEQEETSAPGIPPRSSQHKRRPERRPMPLLNKSWISLIGVFIISIGLFFVYEKEIPGYWSVLYDKKEVFQSKEQMFNGMEIRKSASDRSTKASSQPAEQDVPAELATDGLSLTEPTKDSASAQPAKQVQEVPLVFTKPSYDRIIKHTVGSGETLYRISLQYYKNGKYSSFLAEHNRFRSPSELIAGTIIEVPFPPAPRP